MLYLGIFSIVIFIWKNGFYNSRQVETALIYIILILAFSFIFIISFRYFINNPKRKKIFKSFQFLAGAFIFLLIFIFGIVLIRHPYFLLTTKHTPKYIEIFYLVVSFFVFINAIIAVTTAREKWLFYHLNPSAVFIISFAIVIFAGGFMLWLLPTTHKTEISFIDSLFTSTSAVCVTGLSTVNIYDTFSYEGQTVMIFLVQIGGLGIITITSFIALFLRRGFRLKDQVLIKEIFSDENFTSLGSMITAIIVMTFGIELAGAIALYLSWYNIPVNWFERIFNAVFHSVNAYCNAGFSNFPDGLETSYLHNHFPTLTIVMLLIVCGGLGFYTFVDLFNREKVGLIKRKKIKLQTRIVLISTLILIFGGAFLIFVLQYTEWQYLSLSEKIMNSLFASVTSRTAGFSNVGIGNLLQPTCMIIIMLMYVGAAPNSTAGGIKITTAVTLFSSVVAFIKGKDKVEIGWNTINMLIIRRAYVVFVTSVVLIFGATLLLCITENMAEEAKNFDVFDLFFETVSAFGTVGLSRGITPDMTTYGKIIIISVMYLGRVGTFTLAVAVGEERIHSNYRFPETNIIVG
jgi:potassium uptake TrkH family protein